MRDPEAEDGTISFSEREWQVLQELAEGADNQTIATRLNLSPKTIEMHLTSIYAKLQVKSRSQAMRWYLTQGDNSGS